MKPINGKQKRRAPKPTTASRMRLVSATVATAVAVLALGLTAAGLGYSFTSPAAQGSPLCSSYEPLAPVGGGVIRPVRTQTELDRALVDAKPGDVINLETGTYRELSIREYMGHANGTADAPIVVQAAAGAAPIIDFGNPKDPDLRPVVYVANRSHWKVRGLEVANRTFGLMAANAHSITFEYNDIHSVGYSGIIAQSFYNDRNNTFSSNVRIRCNRIHNTGLDNPEYGEGIYVGSGASGATDRTTGVTIDYNEIYATGNEAIDVKHYTTKVTIADNLIHDVTPWYGGAISLGLNKGNYPSGEYLVENNRIWNVSTRLHYAQAIAVAHGGTVIRNNTIWGIETRVEDGNPWLQEIAVHGDDNPAEWAYGFGNPNATDVVIEDNTVFGCRRGCINSFTDPGMIRPTLTVGHNLVDQASTGDAANDTDTMIDASLLVGPVTGDADAGSGPGSGLALVATPPPTSTTVAGTTSTTAATTTTTAPTTTAPTTTVSTTTTAPTTTAPTTTESTTTTTTRPTSTTTSTTAAPTTTSPSTTSQSTTSQSTTMVATVTSTTTATTTPANTTTTEGGRGRGWKRFGRGTKADQPADATPPGKSSGSF